MKAQAVLKGFTLLMLFEDSFKLEIAPAFWLIHSPSFHFDYLYKYLKALLVMVDCTQCACSMRGMHYLFFIIIYFLQ